jgi:hypothetical protein
VLSLLFAKEITSSNNWKIMIILDYHKMNGIGVKKEVFMLKKLRYTTGFFILTFFLVLLIMKLTFQQLIPDSHQAFIEEKGWDLAFYYPKKEPFIIPEYPEPLETFSSAGVDFTGHGKTKITIHRYRLEQKCDTRYLEAVILSGDNKIIGSYIEVSDTVPGVAEMAEKEDFMNRDYCFN